MNLQINPTQCGAKTRSGSSCQSRAMPNGRCRMHGGSSTGAPTGNDNAVKHGIYRAVLTEEEKAEHDSLELGSVDNELRLVRVRLARALRAERDNPPDDGRDYGTIIERLLGRIEGLEITRKRLAEDSDENTVILIDPNPDI